jgi:putative exosortase-associated protein (TIGR04073 family)
MKQMSKKLLLLSALCLMMPYGAMAESYPSKVVAKLGNGIVNVATGIVEIPKTMLVTSAKKGPLYGMTAGFLTGVFHMTGRTVLGATDVATFLVPTKPVIQPKYVWKNFNRETRYFDYYNMR